LETDYMKHLREEELVRMREVADGAVDRALADCVIRLLEEVQRLRLVNDQLEEIVCDYQRAELAW